MTSAFARLAVKAGLVAVVCLVLFQVEALSAKEPKRSPAGPVVTIHAPQPKQLELALDEVELDWSRQPGVKALAPANAAVPVPGTKLIQSDAVRAVFGVSGASTAVGLLAIAVALEGANPGAEAHLVLYEAGLPASQATRRLLTREVTLLLEQGEDPRGALAGLRAGAIRAVPGVPDGYVVEVTDPLAALDLADALRQRPGVRSAYPLLKRLHFRR